MAREIAVGSTVWLKMPYGSFYLMPKPDCEMVLVAGRGSALHHLGSDLGGVSPRRHPASLGEAHPKGAAELHRIVERHRKIAALTQHVDGGLEGDSVILICLSRAIDQPTGILHKGLEDRLGDLKNVTVVESEPPSGAIWRLFG